MSSTQRPRRIVITGGPGAGKTALLDQLQSCGYAVVPEVARAIIVRRKQMGLSPRPSPSDFAMEILRADVEHHLSAIPTKRDLVFFDRGILDSIGMLAQLGELSDPDREHYLKCFPYFGTVFILPPWSAIYMVDDERDQSYEEAVRVHDWLRRWYAHCGYTLIEVPPAAVAERCDFVLQQLGERRDYA